MTRGQRMLHARVWRLLLPVLALALAFALLRRRTTQLSLHAASSPTPAVQEVQR